MAAERADLSGDNPGRIIAGTRRNILWGSGVGGMMLGLGEKETSATEIFVCLPQRIWSSI